MTLWKCCTQHASKFGKLSSGHRTGKGQFSFQSQRRVMPKNVQTGFRKGTRTRNQIANIHWTIEKAREFQKNIYFCFIVYKKAFKCVDHSKLENSYSLLFTAIRKYSSDSHFAFLHLFFFMAAVTICSDFGAQVNKICHCFHFFSIYLPWSDGTSGGLQSMGSLGVGHDWTPEPQQMTA